jgi:predicted PurR-regulated permease PerM
VGGDTAAALRSAATRGVAYLATSVLTLFLLVHGERMAGSALGQIKNGTRRARVTGVLVGAYGHATRYLLLTSARAVVAGVFVALLAHQAGVPAATLLGIVVGFTSLVPWFGVLVGSIPLLLLTAAFQPGRFWAVLLCLLGYQVAEVLFAQRRIDRASIRIGPVLSLVAAMLGLEVYGLGGMLVALVAVVAAAAVVRELETSESRDLLQAADEVLAVDDGAPTARSPDGPSR